MTLIDEPIRRPTGVPAAVRLDALRPASSTPAERRPSVRRVVLYGDFNCPWSYLASRRAARLAADGLDVDWRAVEHNAPPRRSVAGGNYDSGRHAEAAVAPARLGALLTEMQEVLAHLLPGEELPYALAGFVPHTSAAVAGYAEAYQSGVAAPARELLFEAMWLHAFDLDDPSVIHTLVTDAVRTGAAGTGPLSTWEYGADATHRTTATTERLLDTWVSEFHEQNNQTVPVLVVDGARFVGADAVAWLGAQLQRRGSPS